MTQDEINKKIEEWHKSNSNLRVWEYMGWREREYMEWLEKCTIPERFKKDS